MDNERLPAEFFRKVFRGDSGFGLDPGNCRDGMPRRGQWHVDRRHQDSFLWLSQPDSHPPPFNCAICSLEVARGPLLPKLLLVGQSEAVLKKPFKSPHPDAPSKSTVRRM